MRVDEFDYHLPPERIAQHPLPRRDASRLLVLDRARASIEHRRFPDLLEYLRAGDCLVLNDTRVMPARLWGTKEGGGARIEILLLRRLAPARYEALANRARRLGPGVRVRIGEELVAVTRECLPDGLFVFEFEAPGKVEDALARHGQMPLPPYIDRPPDAEDAQRYQTVYADRPGSAAAPTAGLHFTPELLVAAQERGVEVARVTLHVGLDTFKPITVETVEEHPMHSEWLEVTPAAADAIHRARRAGGRIVAVGTTSVRVLESATGDDGQLAPGTRETRLFIYPGYTFRQVDALVTNFHLPRSTLILLVSAFAGKELLRRAYSEAIEQRYRFYSYGDAMVIV